MDVLGFPNGVCDKHGPKLAVGGEARCLKCDTAARVANQATHMVTTAKDPGHEGMKNIQASAPGESVIKVVKAGERVPVSAAPKPVITSDNPHDAILAIRDAIFRLPMPKNLQQYKKFLKIQQLIDQIVKEDENGKAN